MPKRTDIKKILIIGSGPIVIGQACEFDYSGTQACKALRDEGYEVVLLNSNPATIMTDPEFADATYIEPITAEVLEKIIERERPDVVLPTLGGQTGLNVAVEAADLGIFDKYGVELIGATPDVIKKAEDRELFKKAMEKIGLEMPRSGFARSIEEAMSIVNEIGLFPIIIRPSFTLGGAGGGIAYNIQEFEEIARKGILYSPIKEILIEESVIGWKEFELEVMRDKNDNVVIVCSIENLDPMGVHTGDSITVAPAQTLTDKEYQIMRNAAIDVIREIGVETGGSNIQFAINPENGRMIVIEMNPRVSRSSALASKATGFPIAKIAAKLAVGYTLDEICNDITKKTPACFEPTIDYVVTKIPRWAFEKFPDAKPILTTSMKSVGEVMAIGRTFKESLQKALRGLEIGRAGLGADGKDAVLTMDDLRNKLIVPQPDRIFAIRLALLTGMTCEEISDLTKIDLWFLYNIKEIVDLELLLISEKENLKNDFTYKGLIREAKRFGFSDRQLAYIFGMDEVAVRNKRLECGIKATFQLVDTCAAEFEAYTPYYYSSYETISEVKRSDKKKIMILGGGPNRIGQGIEFDYCCVHAAFALKNDGFETIMVNSNPETVSTDYDTSDKLYFEPLTVEDVLNIYREEQCDGAIVQFGGQTPLNLAHQLEKEGVTIIGTSTDSIDMAEDRERFQKLVEELKLTQPPNGIARSFEEAKDAANMIGYPVLVRPSYVLGGRAMEIVYDEKSLENYMKNATEASPEKPILIDKFLEDAIEIDVDAICDGVDVVIGAIMEHIEEAGVHSGDSACVIPPFSISDDLIQQIKEATVAFAKGLKVKGLLNIQYAIRDDRLYVLEVNPRASRTVPFVSKTIGTPLAKIASRVMAGKTLKELNVKEQLNIDYFSVKEAILPFARFPGVDIILGPEMRSTGEVMGISHDYGVAFAKTQMGFDRTLPLEGSVFVSVKNKDKRTIVFIVKQLVKFGFKIVSTEGTAKILRNNGIDVQQVYKINEGRPNVLDLMINKEIALIINTPGGKKTRVDEAKIRSFAVSRNIPCITTIPGAYAVINGIESLLKKGLTVTPIQEYHKNI
ncbi:MAG: carbamoyl-phosphate synthase large subunit [Candidatus Auribacterota bacterium]|uniref:Carbamoyl phosphate synthase large chain n=1 Tax=Candidatus Auribacter fodinae TaxID=2093366 RepID=A0A3A4R5D7_9BACT|nr:MAG: carbamoyl-phosphate synthase large subunit [Candidatus Auribacter fodinae]